MSNVQMRIFKLRGELQDLRSQCFKYPRGQTDNTVIASMFSDIIDELSRIELDYHTEKQND